MNLQKDSVYLVRYNTANEAVQTIKKVVPASRVITSFDTVIDNTVSQLHIYSGLFTKSIDPDIYEYEQDYLSTVVSSYGNINTVKNHTVKATPKDAPDGYYRLISSFYRYNTITSQFYEIPVENNYLIYNVSTINQLQAVEGTGLSNRTTYRFALNPYNVIVTDTKLQNKNITSSGFSYVFWGNDVTSFDVSGKIVMKLPSNDVKTNDTMYAPFHQLESTEYKQLQQLRHWYWEDKAANTAETLQKQTGFYYRGVLYWGFFENFTVLEDAEQPNTLEYKFRFIAVDKQDYANYDLSIFDTQVRNMQ